MVIPLTQVALLDCSKAKNCLTQNWRALEQCGILFIATFIMRRV